MASCFSWYTQLQGVLTIVSFFHTLINNLPVFLPSINICEIHHVLHRKAYQDSCDTDFKFFILNTILDLKNQRLLAFFKRYFVLKRRVLGGGGTVLATNGPRTAGWGRTKPEASSKFSLGVQEPRYLGRSPTLVQAHQGTASFKAQQSYSTNLCNLRIIKTGMDI